MESQLPNSKANKTLLNLGLSGVGTGTKNPANASPAALSASNDTREQVRQSVMGSLYLLCKGVLGFMDFDPNLHRLMCDLAQQRNTPRTAHLWPRDHYKTSVFGIGLPIFEYLNDHELTILIAASTATNASRRLRRIQGVFERNRLFKWLFPECVPADFNKRWNEVEALCPRTESKVEPTFDTIGVGGRVTGRHYNIKITDDMVDETCLDSSGLPSVVAMDAATQWFDYCEYLLESEYSSRDIVIGTRWAKEDPYDHISRDKRYAFYTHSADGGCCDIHPAGTPIFPQACNRGDHSAPEHRCKMVGFTTDYLHTLQEKDPYKYALQMRNNPIDSSITEFKKEWIQYLRWRDDVVIEGNRVPCIQLGKRVYRLDALNTYLIVDPAYTKKAKNDHTGFLSGAVTSAGDLCILGKKEMRVEPVELVNAIYDAWKKFKPFEVLVEEVSGGKFITPFLNKKAEDNDTYIRTRAIKPGSNAAKPTRIRGLVTPLSHGQFWIAPGETGFVNQLVSYPSSRDHLLDCAAYLHTDGRRPLSDEDIEDSAAQDEALIKAMNRVTGY